MHVVAIGKGTVGTRYIAERDANQEREGQGRRPLFSNDRDGLTPAKANHVLSDGHGKPNKADLRHIVLSPESARAYESLGDTDEERRENFRDAARATMTRFAEALGVKELRWVAGIHLNTDHPHVHILFHKDAIDAETGRPTRIKHIPKEWLMHNEEVPAARQPAAVERDADEASAASGGEGGGAAAEADQPAPIYAYRAVGGQQDTFQQFRGTYLSLEKHEAGRGVARPERRVAVAVEPKDIYDPRGVIEGTDKERSEADEGRMLERLAGVPMHSFAATQTEVLAEFGYKAAADWEDGERDAKEPRRELIVFDASLVREAEEAPEVAPEQQAAADGQEAPQTATRVNYGKLGVYFGEEIEGRAFPVRQIAFHIDHSEDYTRRDLLDARQRKPTEVEKLVGRWVMLEARQNGHEDIGSRILRLRLRDEVARLDAEAIERSQPRPAAYIPMNKLQDAIADNRLSVLRADGTLSPRYHTGGPSRMDEQRARIYDLTPAHGGQIYGVITADTNRIVAREVVTVEPPFRMPPPPAPEPRPAPEPEAGASPPPPGGETPQPAQPSRLSEVEGRHDVGWKLTVHVAEENRAAFAAQLRELRGEHRLPFNYAIHLETEEGRGITASTSDAQGREVISSHTVRPADDYTNENIVLINAGSRDNAELVAALIHTKLDELALEPPAFPIPGEELDARFNEKVVGYFSIDSLDKEFSGFTKAGVPILKGDDQLIMNSRRSENPGGLGPAELRAQAVERSDALLKERYGAFYAGRSYVAPERAAPEQEQAAPAYEPQRLRTGKGGWVHVTPDSPCPVCKKPDNCAVSTDSKRAYCRRVESDREGRDGGWFHDLTKLPDYTPREEQITGPAVVQYAKRPIEDRDRVNRMIMASLTLEERDRTNLLSRGLSPEEIERDGYVSVPVRAHANEIAARIAAEGEDLRGVPGFWRPEGEDGKEGPWQLNLNYWYRGVMIPVRDPQGRVEGFQIRRAEVGEDEPRYVWLSSKSSKDSPKPEGTPSGAPVHFANVENIKASGVAILTEGSLKANVISAYTDRGVVAIAGVSVFQDDFGRRLREELPELRRVWVAYDADATEKKEVQKALDRMSTVLADAGLEVGVMRWPLEEGKGLDDYLQAKLGADFNTARTEERAERQTQALAAAGLTDGAIPPEHRAGPAQTLQPGMVVEATGHVITEEEVTVSDWLHREAQALDRGMSGALRELRRDVAGIDEAARGEGRPEVAAVMHAEDLAAGLESEKLLTHEQLIAHQRTLDRLALGREFAARLELVHAGEKYNRCLEQAETRRYRVLDASTGFNREISARDIEQRAQARGYRTADERAAEVEQAAPKERADLRNEIKQGVIEGDRDEHQSTIEEIGKKHAEQLSGLDRTLQKAYRTHDEVAPDAHAVERAYRARGEDLPTPFIPEEKLDQLHEQALERRDVDTITRIEEIRIEIAREHGVPTRDDERAARLGGQHNVAQSDLRVAERREREFKESSHNRKWEIEGESKKWSLAEVDKEQSRRERELEYLGETGKFLGTRGLAMQLFKQQVLGRVNPVNALRPSSLSPLYPIMHSPPVKAVRIGMQVYRWYQRRQEAQELARAAADSIEHMKELRPQIEERITARQAELETEVSTQGRLAETLGQMHQTETAARAARGLEPAQAKYSEWEFRRLETNSMELRDGDMLREYERAASERVNSEVEKLTADLASGKTPEEAARELVENRIKEAMRQLEPTPKQIHRLGESGAEVPPNRMLASEKIEELTGEEAVWKKAGREAVEKLAASGQPLTPESLLEAHRAAFGSRAVAREIVAEARALDAAARLAQFTEFRDVTQVRYTTPEGAEQSGTLRETQPKNWMDSLKRWLSEDPADVAKREAIERAVAGEEARLSDAYDEARSFHEAARDIAGEYRAQMSPGEELQPQFTSKEASELERFGGGLRPEELTRLEQLAELTEQQATQVQYSRIVQDALADGRVANDPGAQTSQRTSLEREADPIEREARQVAENPELAEGAGAEAGGAEAAVAAETEAEVEEGLTLLL